MLPENCELNEKIRTDPKEANPREMKLQQYTRHQLKVMEWFGNFSHLPITEETSHREQSRKQGILLLQFWWECQKISQCTCSVD